MTSFRVRHPERWWLATRRDLPWLTDPDVDDGRQRWADRNELDWAAVGEAVVSIGFCLTTGSSSVDPDDPTYVIVPTPWVLPEPEATVARSWWGSEAPQGDVWSTGLVNGRHRLWNVWRVAPQAQLPVRSDTLEYLSDVPSMPSLAATIRTSVIAGLRTASPLLLANNSRHSAELRRVAQPGSRMP